MPVGRLWLRTMWLPATIGGFELTGSVLAEDNVARLNDERGFSLNGSAKARNNIAYNNDTGIHVEGSNEVYDNRIYANTTGYSTYWGTSNFYDNRVYNNTTGVYIGRYHGGTFRNNIIYDNSLRGIRDDSLFSYGTLRIENNTIYQTTGDAIFSA